MRAAASRTSAVATTARTPKPSGPAAAGVRELSNSSIKVPPPAERRDPGGAPDGALSRIRTQSSPDVDRDGDVDLPDGALGRQNGGTPIRPGEGDDDGDGDLPDGALVRAGAAPIVRELAGDDGAGTREASTALIVDTAKAAGIDVRVEDLDAPRYRKQLEQLDGLMDRVNDGTREVVVQTAAALAGDDASLGEIIDRLIRLLNETVGRQNGG